MRRNQKRALLDLMQTLLQAHENIRQNIENGNFAMMTDMLTQCQSCAISIGNSIEEEAPCMIPLLEEYCELLYQTSILPKEKLIKETPLQVLDDKIKQIISCITFSIPTDKLQVVFLPYKASMWDSLESIWLAAKDDPDSECFIIPIPYFDKNPDGSFGKEHYEADLFPPYVPITSYGHYDIYEKRPDVIFIHNPYDNTNFVTSVHPYFYSSKLRKCTDMLVYVPYFVTKNNVIKPIHCLLPGTIYADKVIVESKVIRDEYIKHYKEGLEKENASSLLPQADNKFVALGSPKFDKLMNTKIEDIAIPKDWQAKFAGKNGRRKIILYNTHLSGLMKENAELFIKKLQKVLSVFKSHEDILLLWRPHPLSMDTVEAMNPNILDQYRRIVDTYIKEDWGIYDDTPDVHRAILISDAYYGDWSSLVTLFRLTGKPIMIQNVKTG